MATLTKEIIKNKFYNSWHEEKDDKGNNKYKFNRKSEEFKQTVKACLEAAFKDFNFRTLTKKEIDISSHKSMTEYLIDRLTSFVDEFCDYFKSDEILDEKHFDEWHEKTCLCFLKSINPPSDTERHVYEKLYFGKAQKIVNMMFKHLYCIMVFNDKEKECEEYFKHCHMPLDSYTLAWYKRRKLSVIDTKNIDNKETKGYKNKNITFGQMPEWSNIHYVLKKEGEYCTESESVCCDGENISLESNKNGGIIKKYTYNYFRSEIRALIKDEWKHNSNYFGADSAKYKNITPLEAEFFIWKGIQADLTTEGFLFALNESHWLEQLSDQSDGEIKKSIENEKNIIRYMNIDEKIAEVCKCIKSLNKCTCCK